MELTLVDPGLEQARVLLDLGARMKADATEQLAWRMREVVRWNLKCDGAAAIDSRLAHSFLWDWDVESYALLLEAEQVAREGFALLRDY